jgi:phosphoenolpyruvate carboxylase
MVSAVLLGSLGEHARDATRPAWSATLDRAKDAARDAYGELVGDQTRIVRYALAATPMREILELPIASRPSSRKPGVSLPDLRAIPWVFSWNQSRHGIPGWFGLGSALGAIADREGIRRAREMYKGWPFFHALVDNARLALARADLDVAEQYARLAGADGRDVFELVRAEHARTVARIREVTGDSDLLASLPTVASTVERRNPDVDVLSHAQIELLRRLRAVKSDAERARIREALFVTINGIAAGLMTAG